MQRWRDLDAIPADWGRCVMTMGVFDGVHRGHEAIIREAVRLAAERNQPSLLVTFVPHPSEVVRPGTHPPVLTTISRRAELVEALGVDVFFALPFTLDLSRQPAEEFAADVIVSRLHASGVVVGDNFRFGFKAGGDVGLLQQLGAVEGFTAAGVPLLHDGDLPLSSTAVRERVAEGDVPGAAQILGRPHRVDGVVERGDQRGRELGYPTANLRSEPWAAVPADGVYAGRVVRLDEWGRTVRGPALGVGAISVGTNPTFDVRQRRVEAFVLDFDGDLYGAAVGLEFHERLRGQETFDSSDALVAQMARDVERTRALVTS